MAFELPAIGATARRIRAITPELVGQFSVISEDTNPIHLDDAFAQTTRFGRRIAHGMLAGALISAVIGNDLPGKGAIYLGQTLRFAAPVYLGDTITTTVAVTAVRPEKRILTLATTCVNQDGATVVTGEATVMLME